MPLNFVSPIYGTISKSYAKTCCGHWPCCTEERNDDLCPHPVLDKLNDILCSSLMMVVAHHKFLFVSTYVLPLKEAGVSVLEDLCLKPRYFLLNIREM